MLYWAKTITDQTNEQSLLCEISRDNIPEQKDIEETSFTTSIQSVIPSDSSEKHLVITPFSASKETSQFHGDIKDSLDKCSSAKLENEQFSKDDDTSLAKSSGQTSTETEQLHLSKFDVQNLPQDSTILSSSSEIPEICEHISNCTCNRDSNTCSKTKEDTGISISNQNICTVIDTNLKTSNENVDYSIEKKLNNETEICENIDSPVVESIFSTSVPIQVAESVLKTEPKEEFNLIKKEVISEVVSPVQENVPLSETVELADQTRLHNLSSNISPNPVNDIVGTNVSLHESNSSMKQNVEVLETFKTEPEIGITRENIQLNTSKDILEPIKIKQQSSEINSSISTDGTTLETVVKKQDAPVTNPVYKEEEVTKLVDIQQQLQTDEIKILEENKEDSRELQEKSAILLSKSEDQTQKLNETAVDSTISTSDTVKSSEISPIECPIRPNRTKETNLSTPVATTEPIPSVSPTITVLESENQGKTVKKSAKKTVKKTPSEHDSTDGADGDCAEKKSIKKVVKKAVKKSKDTQDEGTESSTSAEKPKKTVKVAKKISKPTQISGINDPPVSETPQVGSSNAPVPPKRKIKTSSTKSAISKKTDAEP